MVSNYDRNGKMKSQINRINSIGKEQIKLTILILSIISFTCIQKNIVIPSNENRDIPNMAETGTNYRDPEYDEYIPVVPFIYGVLSQPQCFDPLGYIDEISKQAILNSLEGLFAYDYDSENGIELIPVIANGYGTWNEEQTELTIKIRRDVRWWDGSRLTADDVVWNFNRISQLIELDIIAQKEYWLNDEENLIFETVEALQKYKIKITLSKFTPMFKSILAEPFASFIKPIDAGMDQIFSIPETKKIIGTGPFKIVEHIEGDDTTFVRNEDHRYGGPDIEKILFSLYENETSLTDALLAQKISIVSNLQYGQWDFAIADPDIFVELVKEDQIYFYQMNVNNIPWAIRKATQFCYDYSYKPTFSWIYPVHNHPLPEGMEGYDANLTGLPYYDLEKAREFILNSDNAEIQANLALNGLDENSDDSAWVVAANSETPVYRANFTHYRLSFYYSLKNYLQDIGIYLVNDQIGNWSTYLTWMENPINLAGLQFSLSRASPELFDPYNMLHPYFGNEGLKNWNGLTNETIDTNLEEISQLEEGSNIRLDLINEVVSQIIIEQAAAMYLFSNYRLVAWNQNSDIGAIGGTKGLLNCRGDIYFYPIDHAPSIALTGIWFIDNWKIWSIGLLGSVFAIAFSCYVLTSFPSDKIQLKHREITIKLPNRKLNIFQRNAILFCIIGFVLTALFPFIGGIIPIVAMPGLCIFISVKIYREIK